jgi:hypothetical protein
LSSRFCVEFILFMDYATLYLKVCQKYFTSQYTHLISQQISNPQPVTPCQGYISIIREKPFTTTVTKDATEKKTKGKAASSERLSCFLRKKI